MSGLNISDANTLTLERADAYGLSRLHQLRGRVGHGRERAYAYFTYPAEKPLTELAYDRQSTIASNADLGPSANCGVSARPIVWLCGGLVAAAAGVAMLVIAAVGMQEARALSAAPACAPGQTTSCYRDLPAVVTGEGVNALRRSPDEYLLWLLAGGDRPREVRARFRSSNAVVEAAAPGTAVTARVYDGRLIAVRLDGVGTAETDRHPRQQLLGGLSVAVPVLTLAAMLLLSAFGMRRDGVRWWSRDSAPEEMPRKRRATAIAVLAFFFGSSAGGIGVAAGEVTTVGFLLTFWVVSAVTAGALGWFLYAKWPR